MVFFHGLLVYILRLLYDTIWKNYGFAKDGFLVFFLQMLQLLFGLLYAIFLLIFDECMDYRYLMLVGNDTRTVNDYRGVKVTTHKVHVTEMAGYPLIALILGFLGYAYIFRKKNRQLFSDEEDQPEQQREDVEEQQQRRRPRRKVSH